MHPVVPFLRRRHDCCAITGLVVLAGDSVSLYIDQRRCPNIEGYYIYVQLREITNIILRVFIYITTRAISNRAVQFTMLCQTYKVHVVPAKASISIV